MQEAHLRRTGVLSRGGLGSEGRGELRERLADQLGAIQAGLLLEQFQRPPFIRGKPEL